MLVWAGSQLALPVYRYRDNCQESHAIKTPRSPRSLRVRKATWHVVAVELLTPFIPRNELSINSFAEFYMLYHLSTRARVAGGVSSVAECLESLTGR